MNAASNEGRDGCNDLCESEPPCIQIDVPDASFIDANNDGIDGVLGCSVFVDAAQGSDLNDGLDAAQAVGQYKTSCLTFGVLLKYRRC